MADHKALRLDKLLAAAGYGSRKDIKKMVRAGVVTVNGQPVKDSAAHVHPDTDEIRADGKKVIYREFIYLLLNKPAGYISATEDFRDPTVIDLIPEEFLHYEPFPVGRLDKDTEGLLLLTNDGQLAHNLLAPKKHVPKIYFARINGSVTEEHIKAFAQGVVLEDGYKTKPAELRILVQGESESEIELTIHEGKFHQVKRMFQAHSLEVIYLKRLSMGPLLLDPALQLGEIRTLTEDEMTQLIEIK